MKHAVFFTSTTSSQVLNFLENCLIEILAQPEHSEKNRVEKCPLDLNMKKKPRRTTDFSSTIKAWKHFCFVMSRTMGMSSLVQVEFLKSISAFLLSNTNTKPYGVTSVEVDLVRHVESRQRWKNKGYKTATPYIYITCNVHLHPDEFRRISFLKCRLELN